MAPDEGLRPVKILALLERIFNGGTPHSTRCLESAKYRQRNNYQQGHDVHAEAPQQDFCSKRKLLPAEMSSALGRNYLIGFQH